MGYRTVVILNNDESSDWRKDEKLGDLISQASCGVHHQPKGFRYGTVVECVHADTQTIGILNTLCFETIEHGHWSRAETNEQMTLKMIKMAAEKIGYRLSKIPEKRAAGR